MGGEARESSEVVFFLGAGASVKAEVPDTYGLVDKFKEHLENNGKTEMLEAVETIVETLEKWQSDLGRKEKRVDVELLLETLERLTNGNEDILLRFHKTTDYKLSGYTDKAPIEDELKNYIKSKAIVETGQIRYLEPLLAFLSDEYPLDVFSVNYDICIEQFCNAYKKDYVDGFDVHWNSKVFERNDIDLRLYKLHGSIMWYRTDRGDYIKIPVRTETATMELLTGEKAESLILYPVRKWDYAEPLLELLVELKKKLQDLKTRFIIVVGYSFRDDHILRVFWDSARKNRNWTLILIDPNTYTIYEEKLREYRFPGLRHSFSSDFDQSSFDSYFPSELAQRVICLPYKFEDIFPLLKNHYLKKLQEGLVNEKNFNALEYQGGNPDWGICIKSYVDCEYMEKVEELIQKIGWDYYRSRDSSESIEIAFKSTINYLACTRPSSAENWWKKFLDSLGYFSVERLEAEMRCEKREPEVELHFRISDSSTRDFKSLIDIIQPLLNYIALKKPLMSRENSTMKEITKALGWFHDNWSAWNKGSIDNNQYAGLRKLSYPELVNSFENEVKRLKDNYSNEQAKKVGNIVKQIESSDFDKLWNRLRNMKF